MMLMSLMLLLATAAQLASTEARPCSGLESNLDYTSCWQERADGARAEVDAAYAHARRVADTSDLQESYGGDARDWLSSPLQESQTDWIKYLDQQCLFEGRIARGGTGTRALVAQCKDRLSRARTEELESVARLMEGNS